MSVYTVSASPAVQSVGGTLKVFPTSSKWSSLDCVSEDNPSGEASTEGTEVTKPAIVIPRHHLLMILVAPSGFKESLGPEQIADAIETGVRRVFKANQAVVHKIPLHDGGEGFCKALVSARHGYLMNAEVVGPVGNIVSSHLGFIDDGRTAVLDMAAAAGLSLVPKDMRDPTVTTTYGVGQLMLTALDNGCRKIIIGCGDSGTSDGGAGMLQALGARLLDINGCELPLAGGGQSLIRLHKIAWDCIHRRLRTNAEDKVEIEAVCNIKNVLCGPLGVATVYGPQKGATPEQVEQLAKALERFADVSRVELNREVATTPGSGASGGLGAGILLLGGRLRPRLEAIDEYFGLESIFQNHWDLVITAEGCLDYQSPQGKMTTEVARRARLHGAQVVALAGTLGEGADRCYDAGIQAFTSIVRGPMSLENAIAKTEKLVQDGAEGMMRTIEAGLALARAEEPAVSKHTTKNLGSAAGGVVLGP